MSMLNIKNNTNKNVVDWKQLNQNKTGYEDQSEKINKKSKLNYLIEIDHPYLQKCYIKASNHILESFEFYQQIKLLKTK